MAWYNSSWAYRVKVTVQASAVPADLTGFPVYVDLSDLPAGFHSHVKSDGGDIRVTQADGTTEVPREVVFYDAGSDTGELHFKGSIDGDTDTDFYIYYGNAGASEPAEDATYGRENVWDSNYVAVYHLHASPGGGAPQMVDSTSNDRDLTANGSMDGADQIAGKLGNATDFDGSDDFLSGVGANLGSNHTVQAWVNPEAYANYDVIIDSQNAGGGTENNQYNLFLDSAGKFNAYGAGFATSLTSVTIDAWNKLDISWDGTNFRLYLNGGLDRTVAGSKPSVTTAVMRVGARSGTTHTFDGTIDEVRISNIQRSTDWLATEYANQNSPGSFFSIGAEEALEVPWADASWQYRLKLTINAADVDADLTDFPVFVRLADLPADFHSHVKSDGGDIRFTDADGNELARDVVFYDGSTDTGEVHVLVPSISAANDTDIYLYYGNAAASDYDPDDAPGREAVWADYEAVYHLQETVNNSAGGYIDSTANHNDATGSSMALTAPTGKLAGKAAEFDGTADYIQLPSGTMNLTGATSPISIQAWAQLDTGVDKDNPIISGRDGGGQPIFSLSSGYDGADNDDTGYAALIVRDNGGAGLTHIHDNTDIVDGAWHLLHATRDTSKAIKIYVDGLQEASGTDTMSGASSYTLGAIGAELAWIASAYGTPEERYTDGKIDEVRIRFGTLSPEWIDAEYANHNSPATFLTAGDEETNTSLDTDYIFISESTKLTKSLTYEVTIPTSTELVQKSLRYAVAVEHSVTKSLTYRVVAEGTVSKSLAYHVVTTPGAATKSLRYAVAVEGVATKSLKYTVVGATASQKSLTYTVVGDQGVQKSLQYTVVVPASVTKSLTYLVTAAASVTRSLKYTVIATPSSVAKFLSYAVVVPQTETKSLTYTVKVEVGKILSLTYAVVIPQPPLQLSLSYIVVQQVAIEKSLRYVVEAQAAITKSLKYTIITLPEALTKSLSYAVLTEHATTKSLRYEVLTLASITKPLAYHVLTTLAVTKSLTYEVLTEAALQKSLKYTVIGQSTLQKSLTYDVLTVGAITKSLTYRALREVVETRSLTYTVIGDIAISKSLRYAVHTVDAATKSLTYAVITSTAVQKSLTYGIAEITRITKSLRYKAVQRTKLEKSLTYFVLNNPYSPVSGYDRNPQYEQEGGYGRNPSYSVDTSNGYTRI